MKTLDGSTPDDAFDAFGIRMERHGRFIISDNRRTPQQQAQLLAALRDSYTAYEQQIRDKSAELEAILLEHDPLDIIARFMLNTVVFPWTTQAQITSPEIPSFYAEYLALLALKRPYPKTDPLRDYGIIQRVQGLLDEIQNATVWLNIAYNANPNKTAPHTPPSNWR